MKSVVVYCAASAKIPQDFLEAGRQVGRLLAQRGYTVYTGGGRTGLMAAVIDGAVSQGGKAVGVLPSFMIRNGWNHPGLTEMVEVDGMHERKAEFLRNAEAVIALPGGTGTFDELFESITMRQLNLYHGRIVVMNYRGYYDPLIEQIRRAIDLQFMSPDHAELFETASTPEETVAKALTPDTHGDFEQKIR